MDRGQASCYQARFSGAEDHSQVSHLGECLSDLHAVGDYELMCLVATEIHIVILTGIDQKSCVKLSCINCKIDPASSPVAYASFHTARANFVWAPRCWWERSKKRKTYELSDQPFLSVSTTRCLEVLVVRQ